MMNISKKSASTVGFPEREVLRIFLEFDGFGSSILAARCRFGLGPRPSALGPRANAHCLSGVQNLDRMWLLHCLHRAVHGMIPSGAHIVV
jgi:hypothetical protein